MKALLLIQIFLFTISAQIIETNKMNPDGYIGGWTINLQTKYYNYSSEIIYSGIGIGSINSKFGIPKIDLSIKRPLSQTFTVGLDIAFNKYEWSHPQLQYYKSPTENFIFYQEKYIIRNYEIGLNATLYLK